MKRNLFVTLVIVGCFNGFAQAAVMEMNWDMDGMGNALPAGSVIDNEYANQGMMISAINATASHPSKAIIFNSASPTGGDTDLGTPNPALHASNTVGYGNVLILAENDVDGNANGLVDVPDDEGNQPAGSLIFKMSSILNEAHFVLIDIEEAGGTIQFFLNSAFVNSVAIPALADGSVQTVDRPAGANFDEVRVNLAGSGAIARVTLVPEPGTLGLLLLGCFAVLLRNRNLVN